MKNLKIIIILFVILLAHALVLWVVLGTGKNDDTNATKEVKGKAEIRKEQPNAGVSVPAVDQKATVRQPVKRQSAREQVRRAYDYQGSAKDRVPGMRTGTPGRAGILVDLSTRKVLWSKNPKNAVPIASMTKLMTVLVAYEMVLNKNNNYTLETPVKVSVAAYKIGGSQVYLDPKETFTLRELMMAASIKSANDAAYLLAEFLGKGDVNTFVRKMNAKAAELGMKHTKFRNPHGLPGKTSAEDNVSSPEDMVRLAEATLLHPQLMKWAAAPKAPFRKPGTKGYMVMHNHNHLVPGGRNPAVGVDGLKTGFIQRSGYCVAISCKRGDRRVVAVVMGHPTWKERDRFVKSLLDWGYAKASKQ